MKYVKDLDHHNIPALPTVLLSNMLSILNKLDELEAWVKFKRELKETCLFSFY